MSCLLPTPGWVCRSCVRGLVQQTRGLRVRPRARPQTAAAPSRLPPAETVTLTDGTTIRVQAERRQTPDVIATAPVKSSPAPAEPTPTPTPTPPRRQPADTSPPTRQPPDTSPLVPSAPSSSPPRSKSRTPPNTPPAGPHDYNWYFETLPPTPAHKTHANSFFDHHGKHATLLRSIAQFRMLPETDVPEVAFIGRSNVGKSSLLNAVMGCNTTRLLARTSRTPGFTKTMNLYGIGPEPGVRIATTSLHASGDRGRETITGRGGLVIVDMPGYGAGSLTAWGVEIMKYIQSRKALRRVFVLLDAEHGVKDKDRSILASLRLAGVSHQVVLSKADKLYVPPADEVRRVAKGAKVKRKGGVDALRARMRELLPDIRPAHGGAALGEVLACSSEVMVDGKRMGVEDVRFAVLRAVGLEGEERKGFTVSKKKMKKKEKIVAERGAA